MKKYLFVVVTVCLFIIIANHTFAAALQSHRLKYRIEYFVGQKSFIEKYLPFLGGGVPLSGKIDQVLRKTAEGDWLLERSGLIYGFKAREISQFRIQGSEIQPIWYLRNQTGISKDNFAEIRFPTKNTSVFDPITLALRIAFDLQENPKKKIFRYTLAEAPGAEKPKEYQLTRRESIDTPVGEINTVVIEENSPDIGKQYIFWLAPAYGYMLVRARTLEEGTKKIEINVKGGSIGKKKL